MNNNYTFNTHYAGLAAMGIWIQKKEIWQAVVDNVVIRQKTVKHRPIDKLCDVFIHILTGEQRMVTMNTELRCDEGLQQAFGRKTCVEQSLASSTLDRCDEETIAQMYQVLNELMQKHSQSYTHDYNFCQHVLDVDMTGLLAGEQGEGSEKGYFANKRGVRGRQWYVDPRDAGREVGWVTTPHSYVRPTYQLAVRKRNKKGKWIYSVLITTLSPHSLQWLAQQPTPRQLPTTNRTMWAFLHAYDRRGGGVETSIRESKQALGLNKRNKRRFVAQEMLVLLTQLAHNVLIWFHHAMSTVDARWRTYGLLRLVRDLLGMGGFLAVDEANHISCVALKPRTSMAIHWKNTARLLFHPNELSFCLYEI